MATTHTDTQPLAVSVPEFARAVGISTTGVRRRIADGTIRARRIGARIVIPRTEIARVLGLPAVPAPEATR